MEDIEKLKKRRAEQELIKKQEEDRKRMASSKKKKRLIDMLEKRKAELGVETMRKALVEGGINLKAQPNEGFSALIYESGSVEQEKEQIKTVKQLKNDIELLNLDMEETRDQESIKSVMKKYTKLWKNLFQKYSNTGFSNKGSSANFD